MPQPLESARPRRRRLTLSLRALILLVVVVACWLAWVTNRARHQARVLAAMKGWDQSLKVKWEFDYEYSADTRLGAPPPKPPGPAWLRKWVGDDYFREVRYVTLGDMFQTGRPNGPEVAQADAEKLRLVASLRTLESLGLHEMAINDAGLAPLANLTHLERLRIDGCYNLTDNALAHLEGLESLESVEIRFSPITDRSFVHLAKLPRLRELILDFHDGGGEGIGHLRSMRSLESLELSGPSISDDALLHIAGLPRLRDIVIHGGKFTDRGLEHIARIQNLRILILSDGKFTDRGFAHIARAQNLRELALGECSISEVGLQQLSALKKLEKLDIYPAQPLTDRIIEPIQQLRALEMLTLGDPEDQGSKLTAEGLSQLARKLPRLNSLILPSRYANSPPLVELAKERPTLYLGFDL